MSHIFQWCGDPFLLYRTCSFLALIHRSHINNSLCSMTIIPFDEHHYWVSLLCCRAMRVFYRHYNVDLDIVPGPQLLFWTLTLKTRQEAPLTRSASRRRQPQQTTTHVYKVCFSRSLSGERKTCKYVYVLLLLKKLEKLSYMGDRLPFACMYVMYLWNIPCFPVCC